MSCCRNPTQIVTCIVFANAPLDAAAWNILQWRAGFCSLQVPAGAHKVAVQLSRRRPGQVGARRDRPVRRWQLASSRL